MRQRTGSLGRAEGAVVRRVLGLPAGQGTAPVRHERDLPVAMADGAVLLADRWAPLGLGRAPVVLVRSPYGRRGAWGMLYGRPLAAAGWSVVIASVRGTSGSGDRIAPMVHEAADGAATVAWLRRQPWWDGRLATIGLSYLGYTQWALVTDPPPELAAMVVQVGPHEMADVNWPGGAFALADSLGWAQLVDGAWREARPAALPGALGRRRALSTALGPGSGRPLGEASAVATGARVEWWEGWLTHPAPDPWWRSYDCSSALDRVSVPVLLQGGWQDLFRRPVIAQHRALTDRGVPVGLTMGPWTHAGIVRAWPMLLADAAAWISAAFDGRVPEGAGTVRTAVLGAGRHSGAGRRWGAGSGASGAGRRWGAGSGAGGGWRTWASWPPPGTSLRQWSLGADGTLLAGPPPASGGDPGGAAPPDRPALATVVFDPADPTPSVGGALLGPGAGVVDQRRLEARPDVAVWTGEVQRAALEVAGTVVASVDLDADGPHHCFVRLCDVDPAGRSRNVCDGIASARSGRTVVDVDLGPVAARWAVGHRLRLQVSGGAHPRFAAHPGTDEPLATAAGGRPVRITVVAGSVHLPVLDVRPTRGPGAAPPVPPHTHCGSD